MTQAKSVTIMGLKSPLDGLWLDSPHARWVYALAHGAGAGMDHSFMQSLSTELLKQGIATLRFQFPYMQAGKKRPDPPVVLTAAVRAAAKMAKSLAGGRPVLMGGKSMGGRMSSTAQSEMALEGISGLIFVGFPLHPPKEPGDKRAEHIFNIKIPMLFLQGTRDTLADLGLMRAVFKRLDQKNSLLHEVHGADHSFSILKSSGRTDGEVISELTQTIATFCTLVC